MSAWKTAGDWAAEGFPGLPSTRQGVEALSRREGWRDLGTEHARKRAGRGGGWEYHVNCLPDEARIAWERRQAAAVVEAKVETQLSAARDAGATLDARRRRIMEARAAVLLEIDRRSAENGESFNAAVRGFLADAGEDLLGPELKAVLSNAVEKGTGASVPTLFNWRRAMQQGGIKALAPKQRRQETKADFDALYPWFNDFLRHYARPQGPSIQKALSKMEGDVPSYDQVRRALKALQGTDRHLQAHSGREGPLALKARLMFKRRTLEGMEPTVLYTADGKTFDAEIGHPMHGQPFRPEITTVLDIVTRKIVGWSVDLAENNRTAPTPSHLSVWEGYSCDGRCVPVPR